MQFADAVAERNSLSAVHLRRVLGQARLQPAVQQALAPAPRAQTKNWLAYRERMVEPRRIRAGLAFWQAHAKALRRAEARFGVPSEIIVGIIGVETLYGRDTGRFRVLDALATLAFDFPSGRPDRSAFFRDELEAFLRTCRPPRCQPLTLRGSFAGAMGLPQFMPSSLQRFGLDFDGDGRIDLNGSAVDAIGSVANFLAEHGWRADLPVIRAVQPPSDAQALATLLAPDIRPSFSAADFLRLGAVLADGEIVSDSLWALVELPNGEQPPSYVAGTENFYVLTRYNRSSEYAMAVIALGQAVVAERARVAKASARQFTASDPTPIAAPR